MSSWMMENDLESVSPTIKEESVALTSCMKKHTEAVFKRQPKFDHRNKNPIYSGAEQEFGSARECRIKEWKTGFQSIIVPTEIRNHRRSFSLNAHFWRRVTVKPETSRPRRKRTHERHGLVELSLQNGHGGRYRLAAPEKGERDYALKCILRFGQGSSCCVTCARRSITNEILNNWNTYKWEVKTYDPEGSDDDMHEYAMFLYIAANHYRTFDCKRVDLRAACKLAKVNFCAIEITKADNFRVISSHPEFERTINFFVQDTETEGVKRILDKDSKKYRNDVFIWLKPILSETEYLRIESCKMYITYSNADIGYFHLFEEDPMHPIVKFIQTNNLKRPRHHFVKFYPLLHTLYYYQKFKRVCCNDIMRCCGCWYPREIDERILLYDRRQLDRYHNFEEEFIQMGKLSTINDYLTQDFEKKTWEQVKDFLGDLNTYEDASPTAAPAYTGAALRRLYDEKKVKAALAYSIKAEKRRGQLNPKQNLPKKAERRSRLLRRKSKRSDSKRKIN